MGRGDLGWCRTVVDGLDTIVDNVLKWLYLCILDGYIHTYIHGAEMGRMQSDDDPLLQVHKCAVWPVPAPARRRCAWIAYALHADGYTYSLHCTYYFVM